MSSRRKTIPKPLKQQMWDKYIGREKGIAKCVCCNHNEISKDSFHAGHIVSVKYGGSDTLENLRPICATCNLSMGTQNMDDFINDTFKPRQSDQYDAMINNSKKVEESRGFWGDILIHGAIPPYMCYSWICTCGSVIHEQHFYVKTRKNVTIIPKDDGDMNKIISSHLPHFEVE